MPKASLPACAAPSMVTGSPRSFEGLGGLSSLGDSICSDGLGSGATSGLILSGVGSGSFSGSGGGGGGGGSISIGGEETSRLVLAISDIKYQTSAATAASRTTPMAIPLQRRHGLAACAAYDKASLFALLNFTALSSRLLASHKTNLIELDTAQQIQDFDHFGVLHRRVAAHDHREVRGQGFLGAQALFQFRQADRIGVQKYLPGVINGNRFGLRLFQRNGGAGFWQINLDARDAGVAGEDEDHQHHQQHVHEGRDVDPAGTSARGVFRS